MILTMIRNTELFDAFSDPGFFYSGSGVVDEKWKIHNNTMANGNLVMMGGRYAVMQLEAYWSYFRDILY